MAVVQVAFATTKRHHFVCKIIEIVFFSLECIDHSTMMALSISMASSRVTYQMLGPDLTYLTNISTRNLPMYTLYSTAYSATSP